MLLMKNRILSGDDITELYGITHVYSINEKAESLSKAADYELLAEDLKIQFAENDAIVICGDVAEEDIIAVQDGLLALREKYSISHVINPLRNVNDRKLFNASNKMLLVAKEEVSKVSEIDKIISLAIDRDIDIVGAVIIK